MSIDERLAALRSSAADGDPDAAREVGRLLCLLPVDPDHTGELSEWQREHVEPWLRQVLSSRSTDPVATMLLASRLAADAEQARAARPYAKWRDTVSRLLHEAETLYSKLLEANPGNQAARIGLAELRGEEDAGELPGEAQPFGFYLVESRLSSGSVEARERLLVADPDELRWACDYWLEMMFTLLDGPPSALTLTVHTGPGETTTVDLNGGFDGTIDWDAITLPPLTARPLPAGHPIRTDTGEVIHYGYTHLLA